MNKLAIKASNIGKNYKLGMLHHDTLRDQITHGLRALFGKNGRRTKDSADGGDFWALKDVSFDISHGEVVGIIGRNGAGKSTLLKVLSRITEPTTGEIELYGRVGSLLEVGTGFHPELSGRENIYLNGSILGMSRQEINRKFDEIVAFSEIEKFLDTPVKRYSSGMYVRLAFAVAAHLEPEILIVDEVLAVGDVAFQQKCLGKMGEVAGEGRTVLFVSHNMAAVQSLCSRGIFLRHGKVWKDSDIDEAVREYLATLEKSASQNLADRTERKGKGNVRLVGLDISSGNGTNNIGALATGQPAQFTFHVSDYKQGVNCEFTLYDNHGQPIANFNSIRQSPNDVRDPSLGAQFICNIDELPLVPGRYRVNVGIKRNNEQEDHIEGATFFDVEQGQLGGRPGLGPEASSGRYGAVSMHHQWILPG